MQGRESAISKGSLEKSARLVDVARAAGVSQGTASNVFNRPQIVREEVRDRVLAAAAALGYAGPDPRGRMLRAGKVNAIGVVSSQPLAHFFTDPYARVLLSGIADACDTYGAGLSVVSAARDEQLSWNIQSALVDGFILFCIEDGERLVRLTRERQLPFVALNLAIADETIQAIGIDDAAGARLAAEHLTALGHRRFAILSLPRRDVGHVGPVRADAFARADHPTPGQRVAGYFDALRAAGIDTTAVPIFETANDEASTAAVLDQLFSRSRPTALLVQSDRMAIAAIAWLWDHGLAVPRDVSVIGFDGVNEGAFTSPALTTIAQPTVDIGRLAVRAIVEPDGVIRRHQLPVELVVRGSTAPPPDRE
ncbi:MAG: LacI family DNA-binding transcriptional regulator [Bauldia sp.]|nr:LacI family DNA-binding transcriptional regulator [Bauldia sp.]